MANDLDAGESTSKQQKVLVVHGDDETAKNSVVHLLDRLGLHTIVLHEQAGSGASIMKRLKADEGNGEFSFAIVLLTHEQEMHDGDEHLPNPKAPHTVVSELGLLVSRFGRSRVSALYFDNLDAPHKLEGVRYVRFDPLGGWKMELARELKAAGFNVDRDLAL